MSMVVHRRRTALSVSLFASSLLASACDGDSRGPSTGIAGPALAILSSDYQVTSVSLYRPTSGTLVDDCVTSLSELPQPLSGDAALPSSSQPNHELVVIDRKNSVLTFVNPANCKARGQLSLSTGGFKGNPRDVIGLSATKAYVTRYETNDAPTGEPDQGNDLLIIDPQALAAGEAAIKGRVPLGGYATTLEGSTILARPDRGIVADGKVYVTLGNLSPQFVPGPGRIVIVDSVSDTVSGVIDLPLQKECSGLEYVSSTKRLYVACWGDPGAADPTVGSAVVEIDLSGAEPVLSATIPAAVVGNMPINFGYAAVLNRTAFVGTMGALDTTGEILSVDTLFAVDLDTQVATKALEATGAFNFGRVAADPTRKTIYLPDGDSKLPRVHVLDASGAAVTSSAMFEANPASHLPPREVAWY